MAPNMGSPLDAKIWMETSSTSKVLFFFEKFFVRFEEGISFSQEIVEKMIFQKKNMSHENQWLEDVYPIEIIPFWGTC